MEISNNVSVLIFLALMIIPIWWLVQSGGKKKKELLKRVNQIKSQYQLNFSQSESWDNIVLGLDQAAGKLLWFKDLNGTDQHILIDLDAIDQCKKVNVSRNVKVGKDSSLVVDQLGLELIPAAGNGVPTVLEFYNSNNSFLFNFQLELQGKWHTAIEEAIKGRGAVNSPKTAQYALSSLPSM